MADYTFYALGEASVAVSGPRDLDGINQGDGSHLVTSPVATTITLLSNNWEQISITDNGTNDFSFADNDTGQRLDGAQTFDGIAYSDNTIVEAEYRFTMRDPNTGTIYEAVTVNFRNSNPSYATVEGIAFIDEFPPVGVALEVIAASEGPSNNGSNALPQDTIATPPCFTPGTFVETRQGPVRVERLRAGDEVWTLDHGWQALSWVGHCDVSADLLAANPQLTPVRIARGAFGPNQPNRDMLVSPQHRILVRHPAAELVTGEEETLVAALHLVGMPGVSRAADADWVTYIHLQCAAHEVLSTDGLLTESYNPGAETAGAFNATAQAELYALFPHLAAGSGATLDAARRVLKRHEARILHHAIAA